jgi:hypothetical protein
MVKKQLTERARDFHIVIDDVAIVSWLEFCVVR